MLGGKDYTVTCRHRYAERDRARGSERVRELHMIHTVDDIHPAVPIIKNVP